MAEIINPLAQSKTQEEILVLRLDAIGLSPEILAVCATENLVTLGDLYELSAHSLVATNFSFEQVKFLRSLIDSFRLRRKSPAPLDEKMKMAVRQRIDIAWARLEPTLVIATVNLHHAQARFVDAQTASVRNALEFLPPEVRAQVLEALKHG
jgi:hypothetical protein